MTSAKSDGRAGAVKSIAKGGVRLGRAVACLLCLSALWSARAFAGPEDGVVAAGSATITRPDALTTLINQATDKAIINWRGFSIDVNELVRFLQPQAGSVALNRVTGIDPSTLLGQLVANGRVFIVNPNGVLFGPEARVDVAGLLATTFDIKDSDFLAGKYDFLQKEGTDPAYVVNQGEIKIARNGFVFLVAPGVKNEGLVIAQIGKVVLGSGSKFTVDFHGDGLLTYTIAGKVVDKVRTPDGKPLTAAVSNSGKISNRGGEVVLSGDAAKEIFSSVVNQEGIVEAHSLVNEGGKVRLVGRGEGIVQNAGTIDVSAAQPGAASGAVEIQGQYAGNFGTILARGATDAPGGNVLINSTIQTLIASNSTIDVSGVGNSSAGAALLLSDNDVTFNGQVLARGGELGGAGGYVDVSGAGGLTFIGSVDAGAPNGRAGAVLIDPRFLEVSTGGVAYMPPNNTFGDNVGGTTILTPASIAAVVGGVTLQANTDITFTDPLTTGAGVTSLAVQAGRSVLINASINTSASNAPISITANDTGALGADRLGGAGNITMAAGTTINAGTSTIAMTINPSSAAPFQPGTMSLVNLIARGGVTLSAPNAVSDILISGSTINTSNPAGNGGGVTITAGGGVNLVGTSGIGIDTRSLGGGGDGGDVTITAGGGFGQNALNQILTAGDAGGAGGTVRIRSTIIELNDNINAGNGNIFLEPNAGTTVGLAGGAGTFNLTATEMAKLITTGEVRLGSFDSGAMQVGAFTLPANTALTSGNGINLTGAITSTNNRFLLLNNFGGTVTIGADLSLDGAFAVAPNSGGVTLGGNITTTGDDVGFGSFNPVTLTGANRTINTAGGNILFPDTVNGTTAGAQSLTLNAGAGNITFGAAVGNMTPLASLSATSTGPTIFLNGGLVNTTGAGGQVYSGNVSLGANTVLSAGAGPITSGGTVNGAFSLSANSGGATTFGGLVGNTAPLTSLTTDAGGTTALGGGAVTTTGAQSYGDNVTLGAAATTLTSTGGGTVAFSGTVTGASALAVNTAGATTFGGAVSGLTSLTTNPGGTTAINGGSVTTTGDQTYNDPARIGANTVLAGNDLTFASTLDSDAGNLRTLTVNTTFGGVTTFGGAVGGLDRLASLVTNADGRTAINTATLNLNGASATFNDPVLLGANLTLDEAGTGNVTFNSTVDSAAGNNFTLTVNTGAGATIFNGAVGSDALGALSEDTGLGAVTTNATGSTQLNGGSVRTTGAQTYNDPVTLGANTALTTSGGNLTFGNTLNGLTDGGQALQMTTGAGNIAVTGVVGGAQRLASILIFSANDVTFNAAINTTGGVVQNAGTGTTTFNGGSIGVNLSVTTNNVTLNTATLNVTSTTNLNAQNNVTLNAGLSTGNTVLILANQDDAGAEGFTMNAGGSITTTNDTPAAVSITVNIADADANGTGNATIRSISAGTTSGPAGGRVTIATDLGAIVDGDGAANNITAGNAILTATGGVGTAGDPIETTIARLEGSGGTGGVFITDLAGGLTIGGISATVGVSATTGNIAITALSPLTVGENVTADGPVVLTAGEIADAAVFADDLTVVAGAVVRSNNSSVTLCAGDDVLIQAGATVAAATTITITGPGTAGACADADGGGNVVNNGTVNSPTVTLTSANDVVLGSTTATTLNVTAGTDGTGNILDDGNDATFVAATNLNLTAANHIGGVVGNQSPITFTPGVGFTNLANALDIDLGVGTVTLNQTGAGGNVQIREVNGSLITSSIVFVPFGGAGGAGRQIALIAAGGVLPGTNPGPFVYNGIDLGANGVLDFDFTGTDDHLFFATSSGATANPLQIVSPLTSAAAGRTLTAVATSPLTVTSPITMAGDIPLASTGNAAGDGVFVNNAVTSTAGMITVSAERDVVVGPTGSLNTTAQPITVTADQDLNNVGTVTSSGTIASAGGNITLTGEGISQSAGSIAAGAGILTLDANDGAISLQGTLTTSNATANALVIRDAASLSLSGAITVSNAAGRLTLGGAGADNITGDIGQGAGTLTVAGDTIINAGGSAALPQATNDFNTVTATAGANLSLADANSVSVGTLTAGSTVTLNAGGAINESVNDATAKIVATTASLTAGTGIGTTSPLDTNLTNLSATTATGGINVSDTTGGLNVTTAATTTSGAITLNATGGDLVVSSTTVSAAGGGAVNLTTTTTGDIVLGVVTTTGAVTLNSAGAISDANGDATNVTATSLLIPAATGVGAPGVDALETAVANLEAAVGAGGLFLKNRGDLTIGAAGVSSTGGGITVQTGGTLTVNGTVADSGGGDIFLWATDPVLIADINLNAPMNATGGNGSLSLIADNDINQNANLSAAGAGIILAQSAFGNVNMAAGTSSTAGSGAIFVTANLGAITLSQLSTTGDVFVDAPFSGITDANGAGTLNVTGNNVFFTSLGIIDADVNATTSVNATSALFDILLRTVAANLPVGAITASAGNVSLTANGGSLTSVTVDGAADVIGNTVTLTVTGAGNTIGAGAANRLEVDAATLNAATNGAVGDNIFLADTSGGVAAGAINAGAGNVDLLVTGGSLTSAAVDAVADLVGATVTLATTGAGTLGVSVANPLEINAATLNASTVNQTMWIRDQAGGVAAGLVTTGGAVGSVILTAVGGNITSEGADPDVADIVGGLIRLRTEGAGGSLGDGGPLEINGTTLDAQTAGGGLIRVTDTAGGLTVALANVTGGAGNVTLVAASPLTVSGDVTTTGDVVLTATEANDAPTFADDLTVGAGVTVSGNNVTLQAGDDVVLQGGSTVTAAAALNVTAAFGDSDGGGGASLLGTLTSGAGTTLTSDGDLVVGALNAAGQTVNLTSNNGAIVDGNDTALNVRATSLALTASTGIGAGDALETAVGTLEASTLTGGIRVSNTGDLEVGAGGILALTDGDIEVATTGNLDILDVLVSGMRRIALQGAGIRLGGFGVGSAVSGASVSLLARSTGILLGDSTTHPGDVLAAGDITLISAGNIVVDEGTLVQAGIGGAGDLTATAGGDIVLSATTQPGAQIANAGAGNVTLSAGGSITMGAGTGGVTSFTGNVALTATTGDITMDGASAGVTSIGGNVSLTANNNLNVGAIATGGDVSLTATGGAITDTNDAADNVSATNLVATAATGIGAADALETTVTTLTATTTGGGNIALIETDGLTALHLNAGAGNVTLTVGGAVTDADPETDLTANVALVTNVGAGDFGTLANPIGTAVADLTVDTSAAGGNQFLSERDALTALHLNAGAGTVTLSAGGTLTDADAATDITATAASVTLTASDFGTAASPIQTAVSALTVNTSLSNGNQFIANAGALTALHLNAGAGTVTLSAGGAITDADASADIAASAATVTAAGDFGDGFNPMHTAVADLTVDTAAANGNQFISEADALDALNLSAGAGDVTLTAGGAVNDPDPATDLAARGVTLTAASAGTVASPLHTAIATLSAVTGGEVALAEADTLTLANVTTTDGSVTITSGGRMTANLVTAGGVGRDITLLTTAGDIRAGALTAAGDAVTLLAASAITDTNAAATNLTAASLSATARDGMDLDTDVGAITASVTGTGAITLDETDAVTLLNVTTNNGAITVTSGGTMTATNVGAGGAGRNVTLTTTSGDLQAGTIAAAGDTVTLNSAGAITDANAGVTNITAATLNATADSGIDLDTDVGTITATVLFFGAITLDEVSAVTLANVATASGAISITSGGRMTATNVAGGFVSNVTLTTTAGDIAAGVITASEGTVTLTAASAITDDNAAATNLTAATLSATARDGIDLDTDAGAITASVTGAGAITLRETDAVTLTRVTTNDGAITVTSGDRMDAEEVTARGSGRDITLTTTSGRLVLGIVTANNDTVTLNSGGRTTDGKADDQTNVTAANLSVNAVNGFGTFGDPVETAVTNVAVNGGNGGVFLTNIGALNITTVGAVTGVSVTDSDIAVRANSPITVNAPVTNTGAFDITLVAGGQFPVGRGTEMTINAPITASGGNITLTAGDSILQNADVTTTGAGNITLIAAGSPLGRELKMAAGTTTSSGTGNIVYSAGTDVALATLTTGGDVSVTATAGAITDNNGAANNVTATNLTMTAATGIGAADAMDTDVTTLTATITGAGNIAVVEASGLTALNLDANSGTVTLTAGGAITDADAAADITASAATVTLTGAGDLGTLANPIHTAVADLTVNSAANNGNQFISEADALTALNLNAGNGNVRLTAGGAITDADAAPDLTANDANLTAASLGTVASPLGTVLNALTAATGGEVALSELDALTLTNVTTTDGSVSVTSGGALTVTSVTAGGLGRDVTLTTTAGDIAIGNAGITAAGDTVTLTAAGAINGTAGGGADLTAANLVVTAATGIGSTTTLETAVSHLAANVGAGGVSLTNAGGLTLTTLSGVAGVTSLGGVDITATSPLTVSSDVIATGNITLTASDLSDAPALADDLTVNGGVTVQSTTGSITLRAGDDILLQSGSTVNAAGAVTLTAPFNDAGDDAGAVTLGGTMVAGGTLTVNANGDLVVGTILAAGQTVDLTSATGAIVDGNGASNLNVTATTLNATAATEIELDTAVDNLTAVTVASPLGRGLKINEADGLTALNLNAGAGNVTLTAGGAITDPDAAADITATVATVTAASFGAAANAIHTAVSDLTVNTSGANGDQFIANAGALTALNLNAGSGNVTLTAGGALTDADVGVDITATAANVTAPSFGTAANALNTAVSDLTVNTAAANGNQFIANAGALTALNLNAGTGNVTLTATGALGDADAAADITATGANVTAASFGAAANAIHTAVSDLTVNTSASNGDQFISEADGLTALNLNAGTGNVTLTAGGTLTDADAATDITATVASVSLTASDFGTAASPIQTAVSDLTVNTAAANGNQFIANAGALTALNLNAGTGNVTLTAGGALTDGDAAADITATAANVTAPSFGAAANALNTAVSDLTVDTSANNGNQFISSAPGLTALSLNAGNGNVALTAGGAITDADAAADITATAASVTATAFGAAANALHTAVSDLAVNTSATNGDQFISSAPGLTALSLNAGNGNVALTAGGAIADADAAADITATTASVTATAFGVAGNAIHTAVSDLTVNTSAANGNQFISSAPSLTALNLNAGTGNVTLSAGGAITDGDAAADITATAADVTATALGTAANAIHTAVSSLTVDTSAANGNQFLNEADALSALNLNAGAGNVTLTAGGAISDADTAADITATAANVTTTAFGTAATAINTAVSDLTVNTAAANGSQFIANAGALTALNLNAGTGNVTLTATGAISDADAAADITATVANVTATSSGTAANALHTAVSDLTVNTSAANGDQFISSAPSLTALNLNAGSGNVTLTAGGAIGDADAAADITGTVVSVTATAFGTAANAIGTAAGDLTVNTAGANGNQFISEADALTALNLNAGAGNVTLSAGAIADADAAADITATAANVTATAFGTAANAINTTVASLTVDTSANNGNQFIREADGLTALSLNAGNGNVTLTAGGAITDADAAGDIAATAANVTAPAFGTAANAIHTAVSDLAVNTSAANGDQFISEADGLTGLNLNAGTGNVTLTAGGALTDADAAADIIATSATVTLTASDFGTVANPINTVVASLTVDTSASNGNQFIREADGLTALNLNAGAGNVTLTAGGAITDVDAAADIRAAAADVTATALGAAANAIGTAVADLTVDTAAANGSQFISEADALSALNLNAGAGNVTLTAGGAIGDTDGNPDITANAAGVTATALGAATDPMGTAVSDLTVNTAAANGNQFIREADGLTALNLNAGTGNVTLTAGGAITDADAAADITATAASVTATAFGAAANAIGTAVADLTVNTSGANGSQFISEVDGLTALNLNAGSGNVTLTAGGTLTDADAALDILATVASVSLTASDFGTAANLIQTAVSDLTVNTAASNGSQFIRNTGALNALNLNAGTGNVTLTVEGRVEDADAQADITARTASVAAWSFGADKEHSINTAVEELTVDTSETGVNQFIREVDGLTALNLNAGTGDVKLTAGGAITDADTAADITARAANVIATSVGTAANALRTAVSDLEVFTFAAHGDQFLSNDKALTALRLNAGTGNVTLTVRGAITDLDDAVDLTATTLTLEADSLGIGLQPLQTNVERLIATTNAGGIVLVEEDELALNDVLARRGDIVITNRGGNMVVREVEARQGGVILTSAGSITDDNDHDDIDSDRDGRDIDVNLTARGDSRLMAGFLDRNGNGIFDLDELQPDPQTRWVGLIGTDRDGDFDALFREALEVDVHDGTLTVFAPGISNGISIAINGTVLPSNNLLVLRAPIVPPGLVLFNNRLVGGALFDKLGQALALLNPEVAVGILPGSPRYIYTQLLSLILGDYFIQPLFEEEDLYRRRVGQ